MPHVSDLETVLTAAGDDPTTLLAHALWHRYAPEVAPGDPPAADIATAIGDETANLPPTAHALGTLLESVMPAGDRTRAGAFFTPPDVAAHLVDHLLDPIRDEQPTVCDPTCGSGIFLEAVAHRLIARGGTPREVVTRCLFGAERDEAAASICRLVLWCLADDPELPPGTLEANIRTGDAMLGTDARLPIDSQDRRDLDDWCSARFGADITPHRPVHWHVDVEPDCFDAVIGNPPFLNQLSGNTARTAGERALIRARLEDAVAAYADTASCFLVLASRLTRAGGRFGMIQPMSLLAARDASAARAWLAERARLDGLWIACEKIFEASPDVCAPLFTNAAPDRAATTRWRGREFESIPSTRTALDAATWAPLAAAAFGIPEIVVRSPRTLGSIATATADFRDQYYGLKGLVTDEGGAGDPQLVTTAHVDPARCRWGEIPVRLHGTKWTAPRVRLDALRASPLADWAASRLVPKILVASQTPTIEAVVDESGSWLPSVPLITVVPHDGDELWRIAAALSAPAISAVAAQRYAGTAMSTRAIKVSARQMLELPLPVDEAAWNDMTDAYRRAAASADERRDALEELARAAGAAFGLTTAEQMLVDDWWRRRVR